MRKNPLRVFFNTPNPNLQGGPSTHLPLLEKELSKYISVETYEYGRKTDSENIPTKLLGRLDDFFALRSKIYKRRPDIIHHNTAFDAIAIIRDVPLVWLARIHKIPLLLKMHGSCNELFGNIGTPLKQFRDFNLRNSSCIGVLSNVEKEEYLKNFPFLEGHLKVVKNIIKPFFYQVERREAQVPTILFISRFIREKGMFDILEAVPNVQKRCKNVKFIFIGSGPDAKQFDEEVQKNHLDHYVQRINHIGNAETIEYYRAAWAFVFPTQRLQEGMPMVVAEAMATGVPIVTTKTKFARSYLTAGKHCLFVEYNDPMSIADSIIQLVENTKLRVELSNNTREAAQIFKSEIVVKEFVNIYEELVISGAGTEKSGIRCSRN